MTGTFEMKFVGVVVVTCFVVGFHSIHLKLPIRIFLFKTSKKTIRACSSKNYSNCFACMEKYLDIVGKVAEFGKILFDVHGGSPHKRLEYCNLPL